MKRKKVCPKTMLVKAFFTLIISFSFCNSQVNSWGINPWHLPVPYYSQNIVRIEMAPEEQRVRAFIPTNKHLCLVIDLYGEELLSGADFKGIPGASIGIVLRWLTIDENIFVSDFNLNLLSMNGIQPKMAFALNWPNSFGLLSLGACASVNLERGYKIQYNGAIPEVVDKVNVEDALMGLIIQLESYKTVLDVSTDIYSLQEYPVLGFEANYRLANTVWIGVGVENLLKSDGLPLIRSLSISYIF